MTCEQLPSQPWRSFRAAIAIVVLSVFLLAGVLVYPVFARKSTYTPKHYTELTFPPLGAVQVPEPTQFQLANGIRVYLVEDHQFPFVSGLALFPTGRRLEPADKVGLAAITGQVMRSGGSRHHPTDVLNQMLEQRAAAVETFIGTSAGGSSFFSLTEDFEQVLALFAEIIREPALPLDQLEIAKMQQRGEIARRNDNPGHILSREFQKLIYGPTSPYARTVEYATLDNISRADVVQFHQQAFQPQGMILGIVGDFEPQIIRNLLEAQFGNWHSEPQAQPRLPPVSQAQAGKVFLIDQPQLNQSYVQLGHLGGQLDSPDYAALEVLNRVLNGFGGRLFNRLRSRQGLAYSVYASWSPEYDYPGLFVAGGATQSTTTVPFIQALQTEINAIRTQPISAAELALAKDSVLNAFVFNFQDPSQTLSRLLWYQYYNYPADFIFRFQAAVKATRIVDVQRVAQTYLQPDQLITLVVGNRQDIKPPLNSLLKPGLQVQMIDITIPQPKNHVTQHRPSVD